MDPVKEQAANALKTQLDEVATYDAASLAEGKDLGAINFRSGEGLFEQSIELAREFRSLPLDLLPLATIASLQSPAQQLAAGLKQVASFTLVGQPNPEAQRNAILQNAQTHHDQAFTAMTPHLAYLSLKSAQVQETMRRSAELLEDTQARVQKTFQDLDRQKAEIDSIVRAAREAAAKIGVAQFATKFEEISKSHDNTGRKWLVATAILGIATVVVALGLLFVLPPAGEIKEAGTIQRIVTKLVVISIFYFAAIWSARNYRAHRHLAVVNSHRQSALSTFETFVKASNDEQMKNAVLLEATHCIFAPVITGYLGAEEENPSSRIVEILKTVGGSAGGGKG